MPGGDYSGGVWTVGNLANGAAATLNITATVDPGTAGSTITNTAAISAADQADTVNTNDSDSADITVQSADLSVAKGVDNGSPNEGATIVYTIAVTNNGPNDATGVAVTDTLPAEVTYVSDDAGGDYSGGVWTVGNLANGAAATLNITATVNPGTAGSTITNTAAISAADQADTVNTNDSDSADITVQSADLSVAKGVDNGSPNEGATIVYTIAVTNNGPNDATGVAVTDTLPAEVTYVSDDAGGDYSGGVWTVGNLANGAAATLNITATVNPGTAGSTITNTAAISAADQADTVNTGTTATVPTSPSKVRTCRWPRASTTAARMKAPPSSTPIAVTNNGPNDATGVAVTDTLPAGGDPTSQTTDAGGDY